MEVTTATGGRFGGASESPPCVDYISTVCGVSSKKAQRSIVYDDRPIGDCALHADPGGSTMKRPANLSKGGGIVSADRLCMSAFYRHPRDGVPNG